MSENPPAIIAKAKPLTASEVREHVNLITEVMMSVMKQGTHYDVIPGTKEPTLLKPGAEKVLVTFRIAVVPEVQDMSTEDEIRYRVLARGIHQTTGVIVGVGVGECSTNEEKYKWRGAVCQEEWDETPEARRRKKWNKGWKDKPAYSVQQIRTNPADLANTVLKMAKKRAMVDLALTATAASDVFVQDLEDMPPELLEEHKRKTQEAKQVPRMASGNAQKPASESQCKLLRAKLNKAEKPETALCQAFSVGTLEDLTMGQVNEAIAWIDKD